MHTDAHLSSKGLRFQSDLPRDCTLLQCAVFVPCMRALFLGLRVGKRGAWCMMQGLVPAPYLDAIDRHIEADVHWSERTDR